MQRAPRTAAVRQLAALLVVALVACPMCPWVLLATAIADAQTATRAVQPVAGSEEIPALEHGVWQDLVSGVEHELAPRTPPAPPEADFRASVRAAPADLVPLVTLSNNSRVAQAAPTIAVVPRSLAIVVDVPPPLVAVVHPELRTVPAPASADDAPPPPQRGPPASA